jgi:acetylornithine deacetylase/succinyl-diaminopimelate desuccinylase-like protein
VAAILAEKATVKIDARLVPNQEVGKQVALLKAHLEKHGFADIEVRVLGGGDEWSQTSVREPIAQATQVMYKKHGIRSPTSSCARWAGTPSTATTGTAPSRT